jgi:uncharacterized protein (DUF1778 family)
MSGIASTANQTRSENINLRVSRAQKSLIDRAAHALGRNRSDFMLETACREAESALLDRRYFALTDDAWRSARSAAISSLVRALSMARKS